MSEITGPVVGISLVLSSVFIPTAFMPGLTGQFFRQFALTIACAAIISATNALTLAAPLAPSPGSSRTATGRNSREAAPLAWRMPLCSATRQPVTWSRSSFLHLSGWIHAGQYTDGLPLGAAWAIGFIPGAIAGWFLGKPVNRLLSLFFGLFNKAFDWFTSGYTLLGGPGLASLPCRPRRVLPPAWSA